MPKGILGQLADLARAVASAARTAPPADGTGRSAPPGTRTAPTAPTARRAGPRPEPRGEPREEPRDETRRAASTRPSAGSRLRREPAPTGTADGRPRYAPEADGEPDPGEVVWAWVPYEEDASQGKDRPVLVLDVRAGGDVVGLMLTSKDHAGPRTQGERDHEGRRWMDVGTGAWDSQRRPSEVRLDRVLHLPAASVRREGAALPRDVFERVVAATRSQ